MIVRMPNVHRRGLIAALVILALPAPGGAQLRSPEFLEQNVPALDRSQNAACTSELPIAGMAPAGVYLAVDVTTDSAALRARPAAQDLAARAARNIRAAFGTQGQEFGPGEPRVRWQGAEGTLTVTAHRDGRLTWAEPDGDSLMTAGSRVLASALATLRDSGATLAWPASVTTDSIVFTLRLHTPTFDRKGRVVSPKLDRPEPLFRVMQPWMEPALAIAGGGPRYPSRPKARGVEARVYITVVVDATGKADVATLKDVWPENRPRHRGEHAEHYQAFLESIREFIGTSARFLPALIGGCPVKMTVVQAFEFRLGR